MSLSKSGTRRSPAPQNKLPKTRVFLEHACYICGNILSKAKTTIDHAERIHGFNIPPRAVGRKRPQSRDYEYVRDQSEPHHEDHYACPSCWFHCPETDLRALNEHVREEHEPIKVDITKDDDDGYVSAASGTSASGTRGRRASSRRGSQQPVTNGASVTTADITRKLDELTELFKNFFQK